MFITNKILIINKINNIENDYKLIEKFVKSKTWKLSKLKKLFKLRKLSKFLNLAKSGKKLSKNRNSSNFSIKKLDQAF